MNRPLRRLLIGGVAVVAILATAPVLGALGAGSLTATFAASSDWGTGHEAKVTVTNGTDASVATWRIEFDLPAARRSPASGTPMWFAPATTTSPRRRAGPARSPRARRPRGATSAPAAFRRRATARSTAAAAAVAASRPTRPRAKPPTSQSPTSLAHEPAADQPATNPGAKKVVGYFVEWGVYQRNYHVKNIHTSGSAAKLTHLLYAFGNPSNGQCSVYDSYADYDKAYTAADSVDGVADTWDQPLRGSFNQLRKLKRMYPNLKVLWSFGGWTLSRGFTQAAQNPQAFADSCYNLVKDPRWADVFDGIDIDWEYPNACGDACDSSGPTRSRT
jgi:chitinase